MWALHIRIRMCWNNFKDIWHVNFIIFYSKESEMKKIKKINVPSSFYSVSPSFQLLSPQPSGLRLIVLVCTVKAIWTNERIKRCRKLSNRALFNYFVCIKKDYESADAAYWKNGVLKYKTVGKLFLLQTKSCF